MVLALPAKLPVTFPVNVAVIVPALKFPLPSLFTKVLGVLFAVADAMSLAIEVIVEELTPPILFDEVGMDKLVAKSKSLTGFLEFLIEELNAEIGKVINIITPKNDAERGCQLSLVMQKDGRKVFDELTKQGVIADWREPDVIRIAPVPLYNSFEDVFRFVGIMKSVLG